jgi:cytochrome c oxidase assembly factor CtaG
MHMVQHLLLISVAAPLIAAGRPLDVIAAGFRRRIVLPRRWTWLVAASVVQVGVLLAWHVPSIFESATGSDGIHDLEHATMLLSSIALWLMVRDGFGARRGAGVLVLFICSLPPMGYGVALTLARTAWYRDYPSIADQQLAGVWMWAYGGGAAVIGGVASFASWIISASPRVAHEAA